MNTLLVLLAQTPAAAEAQTIQTMQPLGWLFLIVSVALVVGLVAWCYYKILTAPPAE